ncbi:MAG: response regulator [Abitibacteriaceae bacterium]|nr:response regulator [Abditibacteriaceae bacterium]MBV9865782.1 response regulator [Abditibacteriaceae bacterium]
MPGTSEPIVIVLAEDNEGDRRLTAEMFAESRLANELHCVEDGAQLMDYLYHRGAYSDPATAPHPGLILLDLDMPHKDGHQALREIKADPVLSRIPVVVLTISSEEADKLKSYDLGVVHYLRKPVNPKELIDVIQDFGFYWWEIVRREPRANGLTERRG